MASLLMYFCVIRAQNHARVGKPFILPWSTVLMNLNVLHVYPSAYIEDVSRDVVSILNQEADTFGNILGGPKTA